MLLAMKPAHKMRPAFPVFLAPRGATPLNTDLAELGCQRPAAFAFAGSRGRRRAARAIAAATRTAPRRRVTRVGIRQRFSAYSFAVARASLAVRDRLSTLTHSKVL